MLLLLHCVEPCQLRPPSRASSASSQLAIDVSLVSALRGDDSRVGAARRGGVALEVARRRKERTYRELAGDQGCARLVVFRGGVNGKWSSDARQFLSVLAFSKARTFYFTMQAHTGRA